MPHLMFLCIQLCTYPSTTATLDSTYIKNLLHFAELFRNYLKQIREETSGRLLSCAYRPNGTPNKWWLAFAKRKFMNVIAAPH